MIAPRYIAFAAIGVLLIATAAHAANSAEGPTVSVYTASPQEVAEEIPVTGTLVPREEVLVTPEVEGLGVSEILVEVGDKVLKGQVLAKLNRDTLETQLAQFDAELAQSDASRAQAEAQLAQARANQLNSSKALERTRALKSRGFATAAKVDQDTSAASVGNAQVEAATRSIDVSIANKKALKAQRDQVVWRIGRSEVRASRAGTVSQRNIRIGQIGTSAGLPMFRIIAEGDIELEADIPDIDMPRVRKAMIAAISPAGMADKVRGVVRLIAPEIDKVTRQGRVRIALDKDDRLLIGASARGTLEVGRRTGVTLPVSSVSYDDTGAYVQLVKDKIVKTQRITVGLKGNKFVEVVSGLAAGDQVIARAGTFVREGDRVKPVTAEVKGSSP